MLYVFIYLTRIEHDEINYFRRLIRNDWKWLLLLHIACIIILERKHAFILISFSLSYIIDFLRPTTNIIIEIEKRSKMKFFLEAKIEKVSNKQWQQTTRLRFISDDFAYKHHIYVYIAVVNPPSINLLQSHKSNIINPWSS